MVSVLIPIYKPEFGYLDALFKVLSNQTISDFEIIVSDDDKSTLIDDLKVEYPNLQIEYYQNSIKGIFSNLNNAISHSNGEFLQIICQDDLVDEDFLECQISLLEKHKSAGLVFAKALAMNSTMDEQHPDHSWTYKRHWPELIPAHQVINFFFAYNCFIGNLSPCMLRRTMIEKVGVFSNDYPYIGDLEYWVRVAEHFDFCYNKSVPVYIRGHAAQASNTLGWKSKIIGQSELRQKLLDNSSINKSALYLKCYVNQKMGVPIFHSGIKLFLTTGSIRNFQELIKPPFNIFLTSIIYFFTLNNRFPIFSLSNKDLL